MEILIFIYFAIAAYVAFAVHRPSLPTRLDFWCEIIACVIVGLIWPIHYVILLRQGAK